MDRLTKYRMNIAGEWVEPSSGEFFESFDPYAGKPWALVARGNAADVDTAVNAAQALEILRGDDPVDLLFSDVIMPGGMNGVQLAVEARRIRPELKVLLTSGYTATALSREHGLPDNLNVVEKPYQREELAKKLRLVIGG